MADLMYDLESIRGKMRKRKGGSKDPNEWKPDKAESGKSLKYKFFVLPPVDSMDLWYYEHGKHWIDKKPLECPRIHDGDECPLCQFGFDLMKDVDDKEERRKIARQFLASARYAVNIYFPNVESTPQELRGKVMWFSMPKSIYDIMEEVIMRDPPSDDAIEPEAHGIFFDPSNAFPFVLEVKKKGEFNSYESSRFINKNMPITNGGEEKINEILEQRHDIPALHETRDVDALQAIVDNYKGEESSPAPSKSDKETPKPAAAEKKPEPEPKPEPELESEPEPELESEITESKAPEAEVEKADMEVEDDDLNALLEDLNSD